MDERRRVKFAAVRQALASPASVVTTHNTGTYAQTIGLTSDLQMASDDARAVRISVDFRGRPDAGRISLPRGRFGDMIHGSAARECGGEGEGAWRAVPHLRVARPGPPQRGTSASSSKAHGSTT